MNKNRLELVKEHTNLIYKIASKFYGIEIEDLFQAGVIGLIKAAKNFENNNAKFSTYAYKYIFGEMYLLSLSSKAIRISKDTLRLCKTIEEARNKLTQIQNRIPSTSELSLFLEIDESLICSVESATSTMLSLDTASKENDSNLYESIESAKEENIDDKITIQESMKLLDKDEKKIIEYR